MSHQWSRMCLSCSPDPSSCCCLLSTGPLREGILRLVRSWLRCCLLMLSPDIAISTLLYVRVVPCSLCPREALKCLGYHKYSCEKQLLCFCLWPLSVLGKAQLEILHIGSIYFLTSFIPPWMEPQSPLLAGHFLPLQVSTWPVRWPYTSTGPTQALLDLSPPLSNSTNIRSQIAYPGDVHWCYKENDLAWCI